STGKVAWSHSLGSIVAAPALDTSTGLLVVSRTNGDVTALKVSSGATDWSFSTSKAVTASASIYKGVVYVGSTNDYIYAISESSGKQIWDYKTEGPVTDTGALSSQYTGGFLALLIGSSTGDLYILHASDGKVAIEKTYSSGIVGVAAVKGMVVIETAKGQLDAARTYSGIGVWKYQTGGDLVTAPVLIDGGIFVTAEDGNLYAFTPYGDPPD
ncbi:MAG: PQQ-binding-like beta-propeller repeat protein, partial [Thermoplasmata archaeon]